MADSATKFVNYLSSLPLNEAIKSLESLVTSVSDDLLFKLKTLAEDESLMRKKRDSDGNKRCSLSDVIPSNGTNGHSNKKRKSEKEVDALEEFLCVSLSPVEKDDSAVNDQQNVDGFDDQFDMDSEEDRFAIFATSGITFSENGEVEECSRSSGECEIVPPLTPLDEIVSQNFSQEKSEISNGDSGSQPVGFMKASGDVIITKDLSKARSIFQDIEKDLEKINQVSI